MSVLDPTKIKGQAPLPERFPGDFFVLEWNRDLEVYLLTLDDEDKSTYDLGEDVAAVQLAFQLRGYPVDKSNDLIDQAREFGASQYIPSPYKRIEDRVLPVIPREPKPVTLFPPTEQEHGSRYQTLR